MQCSTLSIGKTKYMVRQSEWFRIDGDNTLRLDYPLNKDSLVWDVGGYKGDFAHKIYEKHKCQVEVFEPIESFYVHIQSRFNTNPDITAHNFGFSDKDSTGYISLANDGSSLHDRGVERNVPVVLRDIFAYIDGYKYIDLIKINIEGEEYALLERILDTGIAGMFTFIQVQFHTFIPNAKERRVKIQERLKKTHKLMWNYNFIWESWEKI